METLSKTKRKARMRALQAVGEALLALPPQRLAWLELPTPLAAALAEGRRLSGHFEAYRRQMQYVGRLLQPYALEPLTELVAALQPGGTIDQARQREAERLAAALLADAALIGALRERFPAIEPQVWHQWRRRILKARQRDPQDEREWRQLVVELRAALDAAPPIPLPKRAEVPELDEEFDDG